MDKTIFSAHGPLVYLSNFLQKFLVCFVNKKKKPEWSNFWDFYLTWRLDQGRISFQAQEVQFHNWCRTDGASVLYWWVVKRLCQFLIVLISPWAAHMETCFNQSNHEKREKLKKGNKHTDACACTNTNTHAHSHTLKVQ